MVIEFDELHTECEDFFRIENVVLFIEERFLISGFILCLNLLVWEMVLAYFDQWREQTEVFIIKFVFQIPDFALDDALWQVLDQYFQNEQLWIGIDVVVIRLSSRTISNQAALWGWPLSFCCSLGLKSFLNLFFLDMVAQHLEGLFNALSYLLIFAFDQPRDQQLLKILKLIQLLHELIWIP